VNAVSNTISDAISVGTASHKLLSDAISALCATVSAISTALSAVSAATAGGSVKGLQSALNALKDRISANSGGGGGGSVTSTELSVRAPWLAAVYKAVSNTQSNATSTLAEISGINLTVAAGERWKIDGVALMSTSAATVGLRMGWSVPPLSTPRFAGFKRICAQQSAVGSHGAGQLQVSGTSTILSLTSTTPAGALFFVEFTAMMDVASAGVAALKFAGIASTAASPIHLLNGTYMMAYRLK
jgi:hypothetical protein